ncbi:protease modulator HflC [Stigmatella aurantiaca]|uniref:Protein HflC n=1 Tax=Stigmatella aurantiaca (strain DW4/3-1) TaxID=378806 RepID=Q092Z2_STIAD|nr:protease modulator HflC [Stigmatella aurantiaca]ADO73640.1 HflC protein [Stigmatella aurantiaca DW4/3-1]EAU66787.1 HflC protein [Stigmatella aurantiaca DW4/3-1]
MKSKMAGVGILFGFVLVTVYSSAFCVGETEQAFIVQFGEIKGEAITEPGLHWKRPFIDEIRRFDKRLLVWEGDVEQIPTLGREFILVSTSARLRITNPRLFLESVHDERGAQNSLDDILHSVVRNKVSGARLEEIIRSSDWRAPSHSLEEGGALQTDVNLALTPDRGCEELEREILKAAQAQISNYGIELLDVRIKRVNYIASVREQVENRMISERQSIAEKFRSEGRGRSEEILGEMQRELQIIRSEASRKAEEIRGEADAQVTHIYGQAYSQNAEFYGFLKTLETYRETMGANTTLMISANSDFYRYLESIGRRFETRPGGGLASAAP